MKMSERRKNTGRKTEAAEKSNGGVGNVIKPISASRLENNRLAR